ncbi:MAG: hypothetical protein IJ339_01690 [Oscillospiraceae bacterium]|nr:hypothetical protein [Oscillospiraceae bacterium]MBQ7816054.1 hypothetical protein [Oscillospiraceae bacterium]
MVHNKIIGAMQVYVYLTLQKNVSVVQLMFINFGITVAVAVAYMWVEKLAGRIAAKAEKTA